MRKNIATAAAFALLLAGCAGPAAAPVTTGPASPPVATAAGKVQTAYPALKALIAAAEADGLIPASDDAAIAAAEAKLDPVVGSLNQPLTVAQAAADLQALASLLPPGTIPSNVQSDINVAVALAETFGGGITFQKAPAKN